MITYFRTCQSIYIGKMTLDKFMEFDPPCKECLVRSMCLIAYGNSNPPPSALEIKSWNLRTKSCTILFSFLINNKYFARPDELISKSI